MPEDARLSPNELLKETVSFVTEEENFRANRSAFWNWQQNYLKNGVTDRESIALAVAEMRDLLETQKALAKKLPMENAVRYAFRLAPAALTFAGCFCPRHPPPLRLEINQDPGCPILPSRLVPKGV